MCKAKRNQVSGISIGRPRGGVDIVGWSEPRVPFLYNSMTLGINLH